jgi:hypothetical protein
MIMGTFGRTLEDKARQLAGEVKSRYWDTSIPGTLKREIALTVDQINRQRELHEKQRRRLLRIECYVGTDLLQLQLRIPRYTPHHFPEEEKLKKRLFEIEKERRNLTLRLEDKHQSLEDRLLNLLNKHEQLDI